MQRNTEEGHGGAVTVRHFHEAIALAVRDVSAENERLRAFVATQNDQLLEARAEIERLRVSVGTLAAKTRIAQGKQQRWKAARDDAERRLEIVRKALIEAELIESEFAADYDDWPDNTEPDPPQREKAYASGL